MNPALQVFLAFVVGLGAGILAPSEGALHAVEPLGTLWINALRMPRRRLAKPAARRSRPLRRG